MKFKRCSRCKEEKTLDKFYKRADFRSKDGLSYHCSECQCKAKSKWYLKNKTDPVVRYKNLISAARQRKLIMTLTLDQYSLLIKNNCYYCCADMSNHVGSGLDRIDNNVGYTPNNVVSCCGVCNTGKSDNFSSEEWKIMIDALIRYRSTL